MSLRFSFTLLFLLAHLFAYSFSQDQQFKIKQILKKFEGKGRCSFSCFSLRDENKNFSYFDEELFSSLSCNKLFTAAAGFDLLGPNFSFKTYLSTNGVITKGVLVGDLILRGSGDPSFSDKDLEQLVFQLKLKNIKEIEGNIVLDKTEFDEIVFSPGWMWELDAKKKGVPLESLMINQGLVDVWVKPSDIPLTAPSVELMPSFIDQKIENHAIMAKIDRFKTSLDIKPKGNKKTWVIDGVMSLDSHPIKLEIPVNDLSSYFSQCFSDLLKMHEIRLNGGFVFKEEKEGSLILAKHSSSSIVDLTKQMLKTNNHLFANALLKKIGRACYGKPGTWPNGCQSVREFLEKLNPKCLDHLVIIDGSGSSCYNKVSSNHLCSFLKEVYHQFPYAPELLSCMSLSGVDGPLKKRFKQKKLHSTLRGFSGSSDNSFFLCGYLFPPKKEPLVFCLITEYEKDKEELFQIDFEQSLIETVFELL